MGFFKKLRKEDSLIPLLFGEINNEELLKFFPNIIGQNNEYIQSFLLNKTIENEECRIQIIAWNKLNEMSIFPKESIAKKVLGFIIEVGMKKGVDYLAVYLDNRARYYNFADGKIIYENANNEIIDKEIQKLFLLSSSVVEKIKFGGKARQNPPDFGFARINFLTPKGLFFCEEPFALLSQDAISKDVVMQATAIMQLLINLPRNVN